MSNQRNLETRTHGEPWRAFSLPSFAHLLPCLQDEYLFPSSPKLIYTEPWKKNTTIRERKYDSSLCSFAFTGRGKRHQEGGQWATPMWMPEDAARYTIPRAPCCLQFWLLRKILVSFKNLQEVESSKLQWSPSTVCVQSRTARFPSCLLWSPEDRTF